MNTVFTRALLTLTLVTLPASALASTKGEAKTDKPKHAHSHALVVAKKEPKTKKATHAGHQAKDSKSVAARATAPKPTKAAP